MPLNEKVDIEIYKRRFTVEMEGLTPIEINTLAQMVEEKMHEAAAENPKIADSSKLAILAALKIAADSFKAAAAHDTLNRAAEHKVEELALALQSALHK